mmetsp:Transcript_71861/g.187338  ORF Transcript_71861/g.187338 Transcript_71861/m.187338 type:complete len:215 (-) Transcript_71861:1827-2471(-)
MSTNPCSLSRSAGCWSAASAHALALREAPGARAAICDADSVARGGGGRSSFAAEVTEQAKDMSAIDCSSRGRDGGTSPEAPGARRAAVEATEQAKDTSAIDGSSRGPGGAAQSPCASGTASQAEVPRLSGFASAASCCVSPMPAICRTTDSRPWTRSAKSWPSSAFKRTPSSSRLSARCSAKARPSSVCTRTPSSSMAVFVAAWSSTAMPLSVT